MAETITTEESQRRLALRVVVAYAMFLKVPGCHEDSLKHVSCQQSDYEQGQRLRRRVTTLRSRLIGFRCSPRQMQRGQFLF